MHTFQQKSTIDSKESIISTNTQRSHILTAHIPASHDIRINQRTEINMPIQRRNIVFITLELDTQKSMAIPILTYIKHLTHDLKSFSYYIRMAINLLSELPPMDEDKQIISDTIAILTGFVKNSEDLSQSDVDALKDWTGGAWSPINNYLRKQIDENELALYQKRELSLGKYGKGNLDERTFAIDTTLDKMKSYSAAVYRYSRVKSGFFQQINKGDFLYDAGYTATSKKYPKDRISAHSTDTPTDESQITFVIFTFPKGTHNGKDISKYSTSPGEAEVLLGRGGCYKILEKYTECGIGYVTLEKTYDMDFSKKTIRDIFTGQPIVRQTISKNITIDGMVYTYAPDEILRDGNCFFNAVIAARALPCSSNDLRKALADQYHTESIRRNGVWAEREDIANLATFLRLRIDVFLINEGRVVYSESFGTGTNIVRLALENNHFSPLIPNQL